MTRVRFNPENVLQMLKEVKILADKNQFSSIEFKKKYPSFYAFRTILYKKGLMARNYGREEWTSIEPNIIMAKQVLRIYNEYIKEVKERHYEKINAKKEKQKVDSLLNSTNPEKQESIISEISMVQPVNLQGVGFTSIKPLHLQKLEKKNELKKQNSARNYEPQNKRTAMSLAKEIRVEGENWTDAISRASKLMNEGKSGTKLQLRPPTIQELFPNAYKQDFDALVRRNEDLKEHLEAKQEELDEVFIKYGHLQSELKDLKTSLSNEQIANQVYTGKLKEAEKGIDENVKMLLENIADYKIKISDLTKENKSLTKKSSIKTTTKKIRLFGIPIFSIEN